MCHLCESASKRASDLSVCICHCLCFGLVLLVRVCLPVPSHSVATLSYFLLVCPAPRFAPVTKASVNVLACIVAECQNHEEKSVSSSCLCMFFIYMYLKYINIMFNQ